MRPLLLLSVLVFFSKVGFAQTKPNQIVGVWVNETKDAYIEIAKKESKYYGKIIWLKKPNQPNGNPKLDGKNPNQALRNKPILGLTIISDLEYADGKWINGTIYSPKEGMKANCSVSMSSENVLIISVSKSIFTSFKTWERL